MSAISIPVSRSQKTFSVAMALLGAVAAAQILAAFFLYTRHRRESQPAEARPAVITKAAAPSVVASAAPVVTAGPESAPRTTARPKAQAERGPASAADTLLRAARSLRERGDTTNAIAKLQQAAALEPENAEVLAELALTYESMQLLDRASDAWRRLQSLGAAVGPLYQLADLKLRVGVAAPTNAGVAGASPLQAGTQPNDGSGIPDGSTFGISEVTLRPEADPDAKTKLLLRVGVKARPGVPIDHTKVKIQVFFYDMLDNDKVVLTDADVSYDWVTRGHNWADTGIEVLDVTYLRPKRAETAPGTATADAPIEVPESVEKAKLARSQPTAGAEILPSSENGNREYLGYIVRVYYKDQLQAVRADPTRLLNLFPPPFTAPPQ
jgi:hypothetical protein